VTHNRSAGRLGIRIKTKFVENSSNDFDVMFRLLEILIPLLSQIFVLRTFDGTLVNQHTTKLSLQGLTKQFVSLFDVHKCVLLLKCIRQEVFQIVLRQESKRSVIQPVLYWCAVGNAAFSSNTSQ
jgi:hypothetical protein